ncbi:MAG: 3-phosphoglycerate dehydrogenase family protein [Defluviitaleaceae bacterium]|nr:3-phosphoglycerate dehydrogenase family protein [Defluviitaleaceae bacterium]
MNNVLTYNITTLNKIAPCGLAELPQERFIIYKNDEIQNPEGILVRSAKINELSDGLLAIARAGAGVNNIPVEECTKKGIVVFNTPGANANAVKELVIASLIFSSRNVYQGIKWTQELAATSEVPTLVEAGKSKFAGPEIKGKTLGVMGLGAIGGLVANAAANLGMNVIGYDPFITIDAAWNLSSKIEKAITEINLYNRLDYLSVHIPVNSETLHMFNREFFKKCKKGIRIVNFSREELFDNEALLEAIEEGIVASYTTDFPSAQLLGHPNVITIPHLGSSTPESEETCATMAATQLRNYLLYGNIKNSVNFPNCRIPYSGRRRICLFTKNEHSIISSVSNILATNNLNINEMVNRSKKDTAYTIIEVDNSDNNIPIQDILNIPDVINGRLI